MLFFFNSHYLLTGLLLLAKVGSVCNVDWIFTMQAPNSYTGINYFNNLENFYYTNDFYINEDFNNWENELAESL